MNILSLFDGISCGRVALERAGIQVDKYFASEIDKYAIHVAKKNYPNTIHVGSVTDVRCEKVPYSNIDRIYYRLQSGTEVNDIAHIDMIIGGSPCQDLSIAKKDGKGLQGEKSGLFFEYVRLLKEVKPKYFLLENVASMKKADKEEITRVLTEIYPDVQCYLINSALVSAQNRRRYYWSNIQGVEQPEDKRIVLNDILQDGAEVDERMVCQIPEKSGQFKSYSLTASYNGAVEWNSVAKKQRTMVRAAGVALRNRGEGKKPEFNGTEKANSMTTVQTDSMVAITPRVGQPQPYPRNYNKLGLPRTEVIEFRDDDKSNSIITNPMKNLLDDGVVIRKLTPIECERLQTLPDNYTEGISNTQRYKAIGNGWTVDVIAHIFSYIKL